LAAGIFGVINGYLGDRGLSLRQGTIVDATHDSCTQFDLEQGR